MKYEFLVVDPDRTNQPAQADGRLGRLCRLSDYVDSKPWLPSDALIDKESAASAVHIIWCLLQGQQIAWEDIH
jgi:hypothetical protein